MFAINGRNRPSMRWILNFNVTDFDPKDRFPELWEGETVDFQLDRVEFSFSNKPKRSSGFGKLYITSKRVLWIGPEKAYDFDVPYITLHAVSKDPNTYPKSCVYCQVDVDEDEIMDDDEEEEGEESSLITEFFLVPEEESDLSNIFHALSHAALINPDEDNDEDEDDGFIFNEEEVMLGSEQARILDHLDSVFQFPTEGTQAEQLTKSEDSQSEFNHPMDS